MENQSRYALLDRTNQAAVAFDASLRPVFVSAAAARMLGIKNRDELGDHAKLLAPLLKLRSERSGEIFLPQQRSLELIVHSADGIPLPVLASTTDERIDGEQLVCFWDLRPFQPWMALVQQTQRLRPALVYASALVGQPLSEQAVDAVIRHSQLTGAGIQENPRVDLLNLLTVAVEIVDNLAPPTFKISVDLPTPALLALSRSAVLRLLCHVFLETVDYSGPLGKAKVGAFLDAGTVHVMVLASRNDTNEPGFGPLELHLLRRAIVTEYRVGTGGPREDMPPDETAFLERNLGDGANLDLLRMLPEESFSENLRIASHVADSAGVLLEAKLIQPKHLFVSLHLPLEGRKLSGVPVVE